jgi:ABC-type Fe3+ transport system permease subunit
VSTPQLVSTILLVAVLLGLAVYYAWRQWQTLRGLDVEELAAEDRRYYRNRGWRRLAGSGLMILLAALFAGSFLIEDRAQELADRNEAARAQHEEVDLNPEERQFRKFWAGYWIVLLLGLLAFLVLAAFDFWATHRYGLRHYRQLQADRRAMLEREIAILRRERNGHG